MIISMPILARRLLKVFIFFFIVFVIGRLSSPYYYDVINLNTANDISEFIHGNIYAEEVDNIYFYINFLITIFISLFICFCLSKFFSLIIKKWRG